MSRLMRWSHSFVLLLTTVLIEGCAREASPEPPKQSTTRPTNSLPDTASGESRESITSKNLALNYLESPESTVKRYQGKIVELTGVVTDYGTAAGRIPFLTLEGIGEPGADSTAIQCLFADPRPWGTAGPDQTATLRGKWPDEWDGAPSLSNCEIISVSGDPPLKIAADKLSEQFQSDRDAMKKRYHGRYVSVTGSVAKKEVDKIGTARLVLRAGKGPQIECRFAVFDGLPVARVSIGESIAVLGKYESFWNSDPQEIVLSYCVLMTEPGRHAATESP